MHAPPFASRSARPKLTALLVDRKGANLVEYIILVGVIALIAIAGFKAFGGKVWDKATKQGESVGNINGTAK